MRGSLLFYKFLFIFILGHLKSLGTKYFSVHAHMNITCDKMQLFDCALIYALIFVQVFLFFVQCGKSIFCFSYREQKNVFSDKKNYRRYIKYMNLCMSVFLARWTYSHELSCDNQCFDIFLKWLLLFLSYRNSTYLKGVDRRDLYFVFS